MKSAARILAASFLAFIGAGLIGSAAKATDVRYEWPAVNGIMVNNACATDDVFRTLKPVTVCTKTEVVKRTACRYHGETELCRDLATGEQEKYDEVVHEQTRCAAYKITDLEVTRTVHTKRCAEYGPVTEASSGECLRMEDYTFKAGRVYHVAKYEMRGGEAGDVYVGSERFVIPACQ